MPDLYDHLLAALLILALPPRAYFAFRTLTRAAAADRPRKRRRIYAIALITQWLLAAFVAIRWLVTARGWTEIGLIPVVTPGAIGVAIGLAVIVTLIALQLRGGPDAAMLDRARGRLAHVEALLPHSPGELRWFRGVAVTAGVCEELLFRGFLIWYFAHFTGLIQSALIASVSFGLGHAYQGPRFVLVTALLGAFLAGVYLISGSLFLPMLIHALMDLYSGWLGYRVLTSAAAAVAPAEPAA